MKPTILLVLTTILAVHVMAQNDRSPFRKKYVRIGIQTIGNGTLDNALNPGDNITKGNLGAGLGGVFEAGRNFYFIGKDKAKLLNVGIDWTFFSASVNPSAKAWDKYAETSGYDKEDFTAKLAISVATKVGPVVSINPVQDLVVDVRAQASLGAYILGPMYEHYENNTPTDTFYASENDKEATGIKKVTQLFATSIRPNIGVTARWRAIGLALDYAPGNIKMKYNRIDNGVETNGKAEVPANSMQVKLSFTL